MQRRLFVTAACAAIALVSLPAAAASGKAALLAFAKTTTSASGAFAQKVQDSKGPVVGADSSGTFLFERPGKFVWDTVKPYPQKIVSDAKTVYVWDPDLNQVTVRKLTQAVSTTPAAVLFGEGNIESVFTLKDIKPSEGLDWVEATPKTEDMTYRRFEIGFDAKGTLAAMRLFDHFGQTVTLRFSDVKTNVALEHKAFAFAIPAGVDVLQDTH